MLALKSKEKMMELEGARPSALLKLEATTVILMTKSTNFKTAILNNTREMLLLFYKKYVF